MKKGPGTDWVASIQCGTSLLCGQCVWEQVGRVPSRAREQGEG